MDQLYWDTFGLERDLCNDILSDLSASSISEIPCNRCKGLETRCLRCKLRLLFDSLRFGDEPRPSKKSFLEIVSSFRNGPTPARCSSTLLDHFTEIKIPLTKQEFEDQEFLRLNQRDEDWPQGNWHPMDSLESRNLDLAKSNVWASELSTVGDSKDAELEDLSTGLSLVHEIGYPIFRPPALELVWDAFYQQHESLRLQQSMNLRYVSWAVYGPSYKRGTAHIVGIWTNCDDPPFWLRLWYRLWYWIQRQRETLCWMGFRIRRAGC